MAKDKPIKKDKETAPRPAVSKSASKSSAGDSKEIKVKVKVKVKVKPEKAAVEPRVAESTDSSPDTSRSTPKKSLFRKEFEPYKVILLEKRKAILGDMAGMRDAVLGDNQQDASGDLSKMPLDMADVGSDHYEREFNITMVEKEHQTLEEIEEALQRMEEGTYFLCANTDCGSVIPVGRLNSKPTAKYCIECQRKAEKGLLS